MLITDVTRSDGGNEYTVRDETGSKYIVSAGDLRRLEIPFTGRSEDYPIELPDEVREKLSFAADKLRCVKYLQWYISGYGEKSIKKLIEKCRENGYEAEAAKSAAELLCEFSVINELSSCERRISAYANEKLYGKYRIRQELSAKGYRRENIDEALESCEIDFYENAVKMYRKLTKRGTPQDIQEKKKLCDKMVRYGYSFDEIKYATSCEYED